MTYSNPFLKITFGGTMADGNEIWSCGISAKQTHSINPDPIAWFNHMATKLPTVKTKVDALIGTSTAKVPTTTYLKWVKFALIGTDGKYMTDAVEVSANQAGVAGYPSNPAAALVVTLDSEKWKDPGKYNRYYLPTVGPAAAPNWKLTTTEQTAFQTVNKTFLDAVNAVLLTDVSGEAAVLAVMSPSGSGYEETVKSIRVGQIVDSQRRRRNKLVEAYTTVALA